MARPLICDICKQPTERVVCKMFLTTLSKRKTKSSPHQQYELHLDVGTCCEDKLKRGFQWRRRMTAAEYQASRKA